ncbi:MAG: hypothetical protein KF773_13085 [Deltaproteobacteria bacterium]|nr:hypothetical protein [Deltaproteobacteria bacterium]
MDLLTELAAWSRVSFAGGAQLRGALGAVTIRERVAPIPRLAAMVPDAPDAHVVRAERLVTLEGEHAVVARVRVADRSRALAIVVGDAAAMTFDGAAHGGPDSSDRDDAVWAFVRELARHAYLGLGELRRRRCVHARPPGWTGIAHAHATRWLHPQFPRTPHAITVFDARPLAPHATTAPSVIDREVLSDRTRGMLKEPPGPVARVVTGSGLAGVVGKIVGRMQDAGTPTTIVRASLADQRFEYVAELEAPAATAGDSLAALVALVESIEPVPMPQLVDVSHRILYWGDEPRGG